MAVDSVLAHTAPMRTTPTKMVMHTVLTMTATTEAMEYRNSFWPIGLRNFSRIAGRVIATRGQGIRQAGGVRDRPAMMASVTAALDELIDLLDLEPLEVNMYRGWSTNEERLRVFGGQ